MGEKILTIYQPFSGLDEKEKKEYIKSRFEGASEGIYKSLDKNLKSKYSPDYIYKWLVEIDKNQDGTLTDSEVAAIGDKSNILKMSTINSQDELNMLQSYIDEEQELCGIKGLEKGLDTNKFIWSTIAKPIILKNTDKIKLADMFTSDNVCNYCNEMSNTSKAHLMELLIEMNFTESEINNLKINLG